MESVSDSTLNFVVLGPLAVYRGTERLELGRTFERRLLALLLAHRRRVLSDDQIIDALWGSQRPLDPRASLQTAISRLRRTLGGGHEVIARVEGGYALQVGESDVDADRFEAMVTSSQEPDIDTLAEALRLWTSDEPFADWRYESFVEIEASRLRELHTQARENLIAARLDSGEHENLIPDIEGMILEHPLRERLYALLMRAQHNAGRKVDALRTFRRAADRFAEIGLDPPQRLADLELQVLADPQPTGAADGPARRNNLPQRRSRVIGRDADIAAIVDLLDWNRLVSIVGPPGVGKTTVCLEASRAIARRSSRECWFVDLGTVWSPEDLVPHLVTDLAVARRATTPGRADVAALVEMIGDAPTLLVLDNCEGVVGALAPIVDLLLLSCPGLVIAATSRQRLGLPGEGYLVLEPLPTGNADDVYATEQDARERNPALALFIERARAATGYGELHPGWLAAAHRLCRRLDGIPLAIELAATQAATLTPGEIEEHLDDQFTILQSHRVSSERHRSLDAAFSVSYDLLDPPEQEALQVLATVDGPFGNVEATRLLATEAAAVTAKLAELSLLSADTGGLATEFTMLRVIRDISRSRAHEAGRTQLHLRRHAECFHDFARRAAPHMPGGRLQPEWLRRVHASAVDVERAVAYLVADGGFEEATDIVASIGTAWEWFGKRPSGFAMARDALAAAGDEVYANTPRAHLVMSVICPDIPDAGYPLAASHALQALRTARTIGDSETETLAWAQLGLHRMLAGRTEEAVPLLMKADELAQEAGAWVASAHLIVSGFVCQGLGEPDEAADRLERAVVASRDAADVVNLTYGLVFLGSTFIDLAQYERSAEVYSEAFVLAERHGFTQLRVAAAAGAALAALLSGAVDAGLGHSIRVSAMLQHATGPDFGALGMVYVAPTDQSEVKTRVREISKRHAEDQARETGRWLLATYVRSSELRGNVSGAADARQVLAALSP